MREIENFYWETITNGFLLIVMLSGAEISKMSFEQIIVSCDIMTCSDSCFVLIKDSGGILAAEIAKWE